MDRTSLEQAIRNSATYLIQNAEDISDDADRITDLTIRIMFEDACGVAVKPTINIDKDIEL